MVNTRDKARILDDLGDKVLGAFAAGVVMARADYSQYLRDHPDWVAQSSSRGLPNWIHDRLWYHLSVLLGETDGVFLIESGATREIVVGDRYRIRVKRHKPPAQVSTYPTQTALNFMGQPPDQLVLEGLEQVHLIAGYVWLKDSAEIGTPVLSLRVGHNNVVWIHELPEDGAAGIPGSVETLPPRDEPDEAAVRSRLERLSREVADQQGP